MGTNGTIMVQFNSRVQNATIPAFRIVLYNNIIENNTS